MRHRRTASRGQAAPAPRDTARGGWNGHSPENTPVFEVVLGEVRRAHKLVAMECLTIKTKGHGQASVAADSPPAEARKETTPVKMVLCSRTAGRERWHIHELENRPRLAASLELVLGSEEGVECVEANPLTGRVLVHYRPELISELVEELIPRAMEFGPMTPQEYPARPKPPTGWSAGHNPGSRDRLHRPQNDAVRRLVLPGARRSGPTLPAPPACLARGGSRRLCTASPRGCNGSGATS